ncbi:hypothetical protein AgCh_027063 [Apium graveolens]
MKQEIDAIEWNKTWELVDLVPENKSIGVKWLFKTKYDADGNIKKHKAHFVVKGYKQKAGVDYQEVFSPIARLETIRLVIALAAQNNWIVHQMDVNNAKDIDNFKGNLKREFEMTDLGLLHFFLGMEIKQNNGGFFISQQNYAKELLKKFKMENANFVSTPVAVGLKLRKNDDSELIDLALFRSLVGNLMYLTAIRPDIAYGVNLLSRFMECPRRSHWEAGKRILRYIEEHSQNEFIIKRMKPDDRILDPNTASPPASPAKDAGGANKEQENEGSRMEE